MRPGSGTGISSHEACSLQGSSAHPSTSVVGYEYVAPSCWLLPIQAVVLGAKPKPLEALQSHVNEVEGGVRSTQVLSDPQASLPSQASKSDRS